VLGLLKPRGHMFRGFDAGGSWSLRFPPLDGVRCYAVVEGGCWLAIDGETAVRLDGGDCVLLTRSQSFRLASDPALEPDDAVALISQVSEGGVTVVNGGGGVTGVGGFFRFDGQHPAALLAMLPPVVHVRAEADRMSLRWSMETMRRELSDPRAGGRLLAEHLGQMMLVLALRAPPVHGAGARTGWLAALADRQLGPVIEAMHRDPARRWTLEALAERAHMSRSKFAGHFRTVVGEPPLQYLTRWRMLLAGDRLTQSRDTISTIAQRIGYESDSAFSAAFRRVMGCAPRDYAANHPRA
jgi:AraC-like DNA-binding protein